MIGPKVASHLSRAASSSLHGSQSSFRNVWHSNNSSLGWNDRFFDSNGYNYRSSRSSSTFNHSGRAVTQAISGLQSSVDFDDRELDIFAVSSSVSPAAPSPPLQGRSRPRAHSTKDISVSKLLQKRCNVAFASQNPESTSDLAIHPLPIPTEPSSSSSANLNVDPASPQTVAPPGPSRKQKSLYLDALNAVAALQSSAEAAKVVRHFLDTIEDPTVVEFDAALHALVTTRQNGEPLGLILETYNAMLEKSLYPTIYTYLSLIRALLDRDSEISQVLESHYTRTQRALLSSSPLPDDSKIQSLQQEKNFQSAFSLFKAALNIGGGANKIPTWVYESLMRSCARHGFADELTQVTAELEARKLKVSPKMFRYMIQALAANGRLEGVTAIYSQFQDHMRNGQLDYLHSDLATPLSQSEARYAVMQVYNQTIEAYFRLGAPDQAIDLLGTMMASTAPSKHRLNSIPPPSSSTYTCVISGFIQTGEIQGAEKWFSKLLEQTLSPKHPLEASEKIPRPDHVAWTLMLDALASESIKETTLTDSQLDGMASQCVSYQWPWAVDKFIHYATLHLSDEIIGRDISHLKPSDVTLYFKLVSESVKTWQKIFLRRPGLPNGWENEIEHVYTILTDLAAGMFYVHKRQSDAQTAESTLRFIIDTLMPCASQISLRVPASPVPNEILNFCLNTLSNFVRCEALRPQVGEGGYNYQDFAKTASRSFMSEHGHLFSISHLFRISAMLDRFEIQDVYLERILAAHGMEKFQKMQTSTSQSTWGRNQWLRVLRWASMDRSSASFESPASPSLFSDIETTSFLSEPSLSSFDGSHRSELTSPDLTSVPKASTPLVSDILHRIIQIGYTSLHPLPLDIQTQVVSITNEEMGDRADEVLATLGLASRNVHVPTSSSQAESPSPLSSTSRPETSIDNSDLSPPINLNPAAATFVPTVSTSLPTSSISPTNVHIEDFIDTYAEDSLVPVLIPARIAIDAKDTTIKTEQLLNQHKKNPRGDSLGAAYKGVLRSFDRGLAPRLDAMASLIDALGRLSKTDEIRVLYTLSQHILKRASFDLRHHANAWFVIENAMVIAHAYSNNLEAAHIHRMRLLREGYAPSADAYAALVLKIQDTTDDTSNAMALFSEAKSRGVVPTIYLYNNVISKLSKARKADLVIEMFHEMRAQQIRPTSVTYGTVIGACVRVGDSHSAEVLFHEMTQAPNFKPRVPPYNNMMQLYTSIKLDRERALHYYEEMKKVGISPTEHTYKLLLDAYGHCDPVDQEGMDHVFRELTEVAAQGSLQMQGLHFNSLITAYGIKMQNLDKAREIFSSAPRFLKGRRDAVVYEAMFDVLRANSRVEEVQGYIEMMNAEGCHMTAYICNVLIGTYSNAGLIDKARELFQGMQDPASGLAAPGNHAPHDPTTGTPIPIMEPIYREPSTWEAMILAEAKAGNLDECHRLLAKMEERRYPTQVYFKLKNLVSQYEAVPPSP